MSKPVCAARRRPDDPDRGLPRLAVHWAGIAALLVAGHLAASAPAFAQEPRIIWPGYMAETGFPGTYIPHFELGIPPGVDPVDETFIDPRQAALRIFDVTNMGGPPAGQLVYTPPPYEVPAGQTGLLFGLAFDDGKRLDTPEIIPDLYAANSSLHGVQIVGPDADGDGRPERLRRGRADAAFMEAQWGTPSGGQPGSIWKIDGRTGVVTLFTTIPGNSGPGIGNIAFDPSNRQFFATDVDTGIVHRIRIDGLLLDTFDHGIDGRPAHGLPPVGDAPLEVMDITNPAFDTEDPETWGYTDPDRQVWGVAVHGRRLFYGAYTSGVGPQVWSIGINFDGTLRNDPRWELDVNADRDYPITDIAFDRRGFMYLAQRGPIENRYDYSRFASTGRGEVLRYWRESPDDPLTPSVWFDPPQEYAVGFPDNFRQAAGGIDLQYGYDSRGYIDYDACDRVIAKTGDALRDNPLYAALLAPGGPFAVHGVQLTNTELVRPLNEPPFGSYFTDYDSFFDDPDVRGHVGDVEIWRPCRGGVGIYLPPGLPPVIVPPPPGIPPCADIDALDFICGPGGELWSWLYLNDTAGIGADSLKATSLKPGVGVSPLIQTLPDPLDPFWLEIMGALPGESVPIGLCLYNSADAAAGGYFPCCQIEVTVTTPIPGCLVASDKRLKRDIALVDRLPSGLGLYRYRYLWSDTEYVGVMAQEVAAVAPEAVVTGDDGYLRVDYAALGTSLTTWDAWRASHPDGER
jgi:hypothetical protein